MKIPEVSFKSYSHVKSSSNNELGLKINNALTKHGFVALSDFGISTELLREVFAASKAFFNLSNRQYSEIYIKFLKERFAEKI